MWNSLKEVFETLNSSDIEYLVLRNYELLTKDTFLIDHPDIDFLCDDREKMTGLLKAFPREKKNDRIHMAIDVNGITVPVDLRYAGDGYYDPEWEKEMLESRTLYNGLCYVMTREDYYYSLLYHALIQKREIAPDYRLRLDAMRRELGIAEDEDIRILEAYMKEKGYCYTYPELAVTMFNIEKADPSLVRNNTVRRIKRYLHGLKYDLGRIWAKR